MTEVVKWDQIMAECGGYRAGFVSVFRKYEGQPTNERTAQGRIVRVTESSFARHAGIDRMTFRGWLGTARRDGVHHTGPARTGQMARQAVKSEKVPIDDKVGMLSDLMSDPKVLRTWREQQAPKVSPADAKAAAAIAKAITDPIARSASKLQLPMWLDQLRTIRETLAEYEFDEDEIKQLDRAIRKVQDEIEVQKFRLGLEVAS